MIGMAAIQFLSHWVDHSNLAKKYAPLAHGVDSRAQLMHS
jgi:hypothetical protein